MQTEPISKITNEKKDQALVLTARNKHIQLKAPLTILWFKEIEAKQDNLWPIRNLVHSD